MSALRLGVDAEWTQPLGPGVWARPQEIVRYRLDTDLLMDVPGTLEQFHAGEPKDRA